MKQQLNEIANQLEAIVKALRALADMEKEKEVLTPSKQKWLSIFQRPEFPHLHKKLPLEDEKDII